MKLISAILTFGATIARPNQDPKPNAYVKIYGELCPTGIVGSSNLTAASLDLYLGTWWTAADCPQPYADNNSKCTYAGYSKLEDPYLQIDNSEIPSGQSRRHVYATGVLLNNKPGEFYVTFKGAPDYPPNPDSDTSNLVVLGTDKNHQVYAYTYSCVEGCDDPNHAPDDLSSCYSEPNFWIMMRDTSNYVDGLTTRDRWNQVMKIYKQAGASDNAVKIMTDNYNLNDISYCGKDM